MKTFDVVIIAHTVDEATRALTVNALQSLRDAQGVVNLCPVVIETGDYFPYCAPTYKYQSPAGWFNYHRALNQAVRMTTSDYLILCNNDVLFGAGFAEVLYDALQKYDSCSPEATGNAGEYKEGYAIGVNGEVRGYCLAVNRRMIQKIGGFDESVDFWYSDHLYADQLQHAGIPHALSYGCHVIHLESKTLDMITVADDYYDITFGQLGKYFEARKRYVKSS